MREINAEDGAEFTDVAGWCGLCDITFGGSMMPRKAIYFKGKYYHHECYPKVVDMYLANKKLEEAKNNET